MQDRPDVDAHHDDRLGVLGPAVRVHRGLDRRPVEVCVRDLRPGAPPEPAEVRHPERRHQRRIAEGLHEVEERRPDRLPVRPRRQHVEPRDPEGTRRPSGMGSDPRPTLGDAVPRSVASLADRPEVAGARVAFAFEVPRSPDPGRVDVDDVRLPADRLPVPAPGTPLEPGLLRPVREVRLDASLATRVRDADHLGIGRLRNAVLDPDDVRLDADVPLVDDADVGRELQEVVRSVRAQEQERPARPEPLPLQVLGPFGDPEVPAREAGRVGRRPEEERVDALGHEAVADDVGGQDVGADPVTPPRRP